MAYIPPYGGVYGQTLRTYRVDFESGIQREKQYILVNATDSESALNIARSLLPPNSLITNISVVL